MVYGTSAQVLLYLGRSAADGSGYFSASNITSAIAEADIIVDSINADADANKKATASSMIAADILFNRFALAQTNGLTQVTGTNGEPGASIAVRDIPSKLAVSILASTSYSFGFATETAYEAGKNYYYNNKN